MNSSLLRKTAMLLDEKSPAMLSILQLEEISAKGINRWSSNPSTYPRALRKGLLGNRLGQLISNIFIDAILLSSSPLHAPSTNPTTVVVARNCFLLIVFAATSSTYFDGLRNTNNLNHEARDRSSAK